MILARATIASLWKVDDRATQAIMAQFYRNYLTADPNDPKKFLDAYDSCDYLHPSDAGYKAMANAIDLALFKTGPSSTSSR